MVANEAMGAIASLSASTANSMARSGSSSAIVPPTAAMARVSTE